MNPAQLTCPKCGLTDQVQKVTSVYGDNTKEWRERHGRHTSFHQARTLLGEKLAPPTKPSGAINPVLWYGIAAFFLIIFGATTCPFIVILPLTLIPILIPLGLALIGAAGTAFYANDATVPTWIAYGSIALIIIVSLIVLAVIIALIVGVIWTIRRIRAGHQHLQTDYQTKKAKLETEDLPRWQRAMDRWNNAYYCMRDETVFIPGENKAIPAANLKDYLFDPYYRPL